MPLNYHVFENIMENGEQMLHFPYYFQKYLKFNLIFFLDFSMLSKIENDVII